MELDNPATPSRRRRRWRRGAVIGLPIALVGAIMLVVLWLSSAIESRLLRGKSVMDLSMRKNFRFAGRFNITPIVDVFNVLNTVNFGAPQMNANNSAFGTINSAQPPRQWQFGVRFDF